MKAKHAKVLVTGGAGFIGSEVTRHLATRAARVLVVDNLVNGRRANLEEVIGGRVELHVADIRDGERMSRLLDGIDVVFHLACLGVRHSLHSPLENHEVNASASLSLLSAAWRLGVKRFVYVSSSEVYGTAQRVPMTESHPTFPATVYGASKLAGECYTRAFHCSFGYPSVVVRPFNTYGPRCHHEGDSGEVIPKFVLRCLAGRPMIVFGDGTQTRDFTFVSDTARGIVLAGFSDAAVGETINLGQGSEIAINDLATEVARVMDTSHPRIQHTDPRPGDVGRLYADGSLAREVLGFVPQVTLRNGLERLRQWYEASTRTPEELLKEEVVENWRISN